MQLGERDDGRDRARYRRDEEPPASKPPAEAGPTKSKEEPMVKVNSIPGRAEKDPTMRDSREKKEDRNIKTADGGKSTLI